MNIETQIKMDRFKPRDYQMNLIKAVESGKRRCMAIWPRRAGKDLCGFNILIKECFRRVGTYFYVFPTFSSGRRILWDAIDNDGRRILEYFAPKELIQSRNEQQMRIKFINGSQIQILGSDNFDNSIIGTNSKGMIFSEYALQSDLPYKFARPILSASDGFAIILSTPRGKNHLFEMYEVARHSPEWFCEMLTIDDTNHIPLSEIEKERQLGELSDDMIMQEYYCSFQFGVEGSYYSKYIDKMNLNNQIGVVPWEPGFKVHVALDIGVRDSTSIIFFQTIGQTVRIIDCYENSKVGLEHYVSVIRAKENEIGYVYGRFIVPHDMKVMEWGSGVTRIEKAKQLGLNCTVAPDIGLMDGIEAVRTTLAKVWIDNRKCVKLIRSLENYRQEYDAKKKVYNTHPLHDQHSHFADAMRYLCISLPKTRDGLSAQDLDKRYNEARGGDNLPSFFRDQI